jgi:hypothetical protein
MVHVNFSGRRFVVMQVITAWFADADTWLVMAQRMPDIVN